MYIVFQDIFVEPIQSMLHTQEGIYNLFLVALALIPWAISIVKMINHISFNRLVTFFTLGGWCFVWYLLILIHYYGTPPHTPQMKYFLLFLLLHVLVLILPQFSNRIYKDSLGAYTITRKILYSILAFVVSVIITIGLIILLVFPAALFNENYLIKTGGKPWIEETEIHRIMGEDALPEFKYIPERSIEGSVHDGYAQLHTATFCNKENGEVLKKMAKKCMDKKSKWQHSTWNEETPQYETTFMKDNTLYKLFISIEKNDTLFINLSINTQ